MHKLIHWVQLRILEWRIRRLKRAVCGSRSYFQRHQLELMHRLNQIRDRS